MDTRLTTKVPVMSVGVSRPEAAPVRQAVTTDLPPPAAVSAQVGADQTRWDRRRAESEPGFPKKHTNTIERDRDTGDLVYKVIDPETRVTVTQYPYEATLKLRAYIKAVDEQNGKSG
jgi:hypothetical protein